MAARSTRADIIGAADRLFYEHGFEHTSFADIAKLVNISRGNFYHHFKTKDEILDAVIERRLADRKAMMHRWEADGRTPAERIRGFVALLLENQDEIKRFGCPIGTLHSELAKLNHGSRQEARELFTLFRVWLRRQFTLMGLEAEADDLAMHLLSRSQGAATMANAFPGEPFLGQEVDQLNAWLDAQAEAARQRQT